jgi:16S rRNA (guanine527-N7)-methyltransferase
VTSGDAASVKRETERLEPRARRLVEAYQLPHSATRQLLRLLEALAVETDPPTTVRDPASAVDRHVADSLAALEMPVVREVRRLLDLGSGAGFPGLPLAVALPRASADLLEASQRKREVIERMAGAAGLTNVRAVRARAEEWAAEEGRGAYRVVTARAVASLAVLAEYAAPLLEIGGALVAWKGRREAEEERAGAAAAAELGLECTEVVAVTPFAGALDRHLHVLVKREPTPPSFPRRPGRAAKVPLA